MIYFTKLLDHISKGAWLCPRIVVLTRLILFEQQKFRLWFRSINYLPVLYLTAGHLFNLNGRKTLCRAPASHCSILQVNDPEHAKTAQTESVSRAGPPFAGPLLCVQPCYCEKRTSAVVSDHSVWMETLEMNAEQCKTTTKKNILSLHMYMNPHQWYARV